MKRFLFLPVIYTLSSVIIPLISTFFHPVSLIQAPPQIQNVATISVYNHLTGVTENMNFEDYLVGVVSAEMPAMFEVEALKAQAVAARTYTIYKSASSAHNGGVCTDYSHCQAFLSDEEMHTNWQGDYDTYREKIKNAVYSTKGEVLTYNSEPVMAVFHSMGGGKTENCEDVWGSPLPYLVSVDSPGEETAVNYNTTYQISWDEFKSKIVSLYPDITLNSYLDISQPTLTDGGHVKSIIIASKVVEGTTIRNLFDLRSTKFTISFEGNNVIFSVTGYGHGVGMSQYGANAMAKEGKTYRDILSHYYQGTVISE